MSYVSNDTAAFHPKSASEEADDGFAEHVYHKLMNEAPRTADGTEAFDHRVEAMRSLSSYMERIDCNEKREKLEDGLDMSMSSGMSDAQALEILEGELESFNETDDAYGDLRRAYEELQGYVEGNNFDNRVQH